MILLEDDLASVVNIDLGDASMGDPKQVSNFFLQEYDHFMGD